MAYQDETLDLGQLFGAVLGVLQQNRQTLNEADGVNHDHGDNMVDTFGTITRAVSQTRTAEPSEQLAYAADALSQSHSGSAQLYARGLAQASSELQGQQLTRSNALSLIQTLLGGGQATPAQPQPQPSAGGLDGLLGALFGGGQVQQQAAQPAQQDDGLDMGDLLRAGMAYFSTKASGGSNVQAVVSAIVAASAMGSGYREQSSSLVASTLLSVVKGMVGGR